MGVMTTYGEVMGEMERVGDERTLVMLNAQTIGELWLPEGVVLHRSSRWVKKRYDVYRHGIWDAISGIMRAKKSAMEWHETPDLFTFLQAVQESLRYLQLYGGLKATALQQVKQLSLEVAQHLMTAENEHKVKAFYQLVRGSRTEDRSGKVNPGKSAAQLVAARDALRRRLHQVGEIYPFLDRDVLAMMALVNEYHTVFDTIRTFGEHWWKRGVDKTPFTPVDAVEFESGAKAAHAMLGSVHALPYRPLAQHLRDLLSTSAFNPRFLEKSELLVVSTVIRRACIAPDRVREVLQTNVQNGYLEIAPFKGREFDDVRDELGAKTLHVMWRAFKIIPDVVRPEAREYLSSVRQQYAEARSADSRKWMLPVRETVRNFASLIA